MLSQCKEIEEKLNIYRRQAGRSLVNIPDSIGGQSVLHIPLYNTLIYMCIYIYTLTCWCVDIISGKQQSVKQAMMSVMMIVWYTADIHLDPCHGHSSITPYLFWAENCHISYFCWEECSDHFWCLYLVCLCLRSLCRAGGQMVEVFQ